MKKYIIYMVTDANRTNLHVGTSSDILKTIDFYRQIPSLYVDVNHQMSRLIYAEFFENEEDAMKKFMQISKYTRAQKEKLIRFLNPNWKDISSKLLVSNTRQPLPVAKSFFAVAS